MKARNNLALKAALLVLRDLFLGALFILGSVGLGIALASAYGRYLGYIFGFLFSCYCILKLFQLKYETLEKKFPEDKNLET